MGKTFHFKHSGCVPLIAWFWTWFVSVLTAICLALHPNSIQSHAHQCTDLRRKATGNCLWKLFHHFSVWVYLLALVGCIRIGEAANPGPQEMSDQHFVLGSFNPSGLRNKAPYIASHLSWGDIWSVSETHLNRHDLAQFRQGLHFAESPLRHCIGGHPVPNFHAWKGVAVISRHPTRPLPHDWPSDIAGSSRALVTTSLVDDLWIHVGTVYGEPDSHAHPHHRANNDQILFHVASRICHLMN